MFFMSVVVLAVGFLFLIRGADFFVEGSAALARNFRVPGLVIGLTIVAAGTSAPELAVSTVAALRGANEIALSNVVGSNIFNLLSVLGLCAVLYPVSAETGVLKRDFPISVLATALVFFLSCGDTVCSGKFFQMKMGDNAGNLGRIAGGILLVLFVGYIVCLIREAKRHPEPEEEGKRMPLRKCFLRITAGLALIIGGGQAVVYGAKEIAGALEMTETLIGLTVVAVGTSLPELVTSIVAARKGETGLAVGNVVGSNIFNLLFILGISAVIHPVGVNAASVYDLGILFLASLLVLFFLRRGKALQRREGLVMVGLYIADMIFAIVRK